MNYIVWFRLEPLNRDDFITVTAAPVSLSHTNYIWSSAQIVQQFIRLGYVLQSSRGNGVGQCLAVEAPCSFL